MDRNNGYMVAATAVWAMICVSAAVTTKHPSSDHAGIFTDHRQHFIGQSFGQPCFGENQPDHDGCENEHDRRVHEILE